MTKNERINELINLFEEFATRNLDLLTLYWTSLNPSYAYRVKQNYEDFNEKLKELIEKE